MIQPQEKPIKQETCSSCHYSVRFVDGYVTKERLFICHMCVNRHIGKILYRVSDHCDKYGDLLRCEVCKKQNSPFTHVEVTEDGEHYVWLHVCGEECLQQVELRWKGVSDVHEPFEVMFKTYEQEEQKEQVVLEENLDEIVYEFEEYKEVIVTRAGNVRMVKCTRGGVFKLYRIEKGEGDNYLHVPAYDLSTAWLCFRAWAHLKR